MLCGMKSCTRATRASSEPPHAAGVVVVCAREGDCEPLFLLLCDARTSEWTPPKGHLSREDGGDAAAAALRELHEESHRRGGPPVNVVPAVGRTRGVVPIPRPLAFSVTPAVAAPALPSTGQVVVVD